MSETFFSSQRLSKILDCPTLSPQDFHFTKITTDSRAIEKGCLFAAIKGEKFDAHDFIEDAILKGASGIIFENALKNKELLTQYPEIYFYPVQNTESALRKIAKDIRNSISIPVICVAGSVGKTTTKELIRTLFEESSLGKENIVSTLGSQNGFLGIPLTLLRIKTSTKLALIEVGIDECGAMIEHMDLLKPTHTLLTAIGPEHLEKLNDIDTVLKEEWISITETLKNKGTVFIQECDPLIEKQSKTLPILSEKIIRISSQKRSDSSHHVYFQQTSPLTFQWISSEEKMEYQSPLLGRHNLENTALAVTVAKHFKLTHEEIKKGLSLFKPAFGRTDIKKIGPHLILCDYYNANPTSMNASLKTLSELHPSSSEKPLKIAFLGDMLELGGNEETYHRALAQTLIDENFNEVYLKGPRMNWLKNELSLKKPNLFVSYQESDSEALAKTFLNQKHPSAHILIKGSRGMKMEQIDQYLTQANEGIKL